MTTSSPHPQSPKQLTLGRQPWLLALAVLLLVGVGAGIGWLAFNRTPSGMQTFEGGGIRMTIPQDWTIEDTSTNKACQTESLECVAILSTPQDYNFSITWYTQPEPTTVQMVDDTEWKKFVSYYPSAILFSREDLQVGGLPAIQRTFMQNDEQNRTIYFRQVYVLNELRLYLITTRFFSAEMMESQAATVDAIIASLHFTGE